MRNVSWSRYLLFALLMAVVPTIASRSYTVRSGDSLSEIAARYHTTPRAIRAQNHLRNLHKLQIGQKLMLQGRASTTRKVVARHKQANAVRTATSRELHRRRAQLLNHHNARKGELIVASARTLQGAPYHRGGLSSRGIDCSGLVVRAMAMQGMRVPHHAATLYQMGKPVSYRNLQPGDLVFFHTTSPGVSHVGIWVGNNKFIHASSGRHRGVVTEQLAGYYAKRLVGARRLH